MSSFRRFIFCILGMGGILIGVITSPGIAADFESPGQGIPMTDKVLGRKIHNDIVADPALPYCAHVIVVKVENGIVTLKGRVHTQDEMESVREKAVSLVGEDNVISDIELF